MRWTTVLLLAAVLLFSACAERSVISERLKEQAAEQITIQEVQTNPTAHKGESVLWGGKIVRTQYTRNGTLVEVVKLPLGSNDRPEEVDRSEGRFLFLHPEFLDSVIYSEGREVTVVGEIQGTRVKQLDEIRYEYPLLLSSKVHLWERKEEREYIYRHAPRYWGSPYWGYPWWW